ncbi:myricetin O-methyltransferase-like [Cucumis melo var. makuwa]|uniref:Myricetin O-methyltransferase-like n=2 Tax=Cucumis melo TaxID=3656 RepID=A0A5D3CHG4_CUCMM|nr:myricetin O-methyltransferase-like [Cucumis melo var. makuwa]TYK10678.1 myricetin O-methyltransferase-like [Cucumis melo var. makuwa]
MEENIELVEAQAHIWNHTFKYINSMSLKCVVELGIPDIIHNHGQPMSLSQLLESLHIHPSKAQCLSRLMRLLVHSGFFAQPQPDFFSLTPPSRLLLRENHKTAFDTTPFLLLILSPLMMSPWQTMSKWLCSQDDDQDQDHYSTAFELANGKPIWDYVKEEEESCGFGKLFHQTLECDSRLIGKVVSSECGEMFEGLRSLVDVGGGAGAMAKAIVEAFPHINCFVLDLPQVVANQKPKQHIQNLHFIEGDMFQKIPPANAVLLKSILHDWNDEESIKILKKCKESIPSRGEGGKVIIIEMVLEKELEQMKKSSVETQLC